MNAALTALLHNPLVWRGDHLARTADAVPSGFPDLDRELPGGGWPKGGLTELLTDDEGIGELGLVLPALRHLVQGGAWIALVAPPHLPYAPAFAGRGIDPARVVVIATTQDKHRWWAAEQVLRANSAGALLFWPHIVNDQRLRRLQLAAQEGCAPAFVFAGSVCAAHPSPAPLRIRLSMDETRLRLDVFKRRGGVMSRPLLLDVRATQTHTGSEAMSAQTVNTRPLASVERLPLHRLLHFRRHYPVGAPQARIWNRALARADEVRRVPRPDPRSTPSRSPGVVPAERSESQDPAAFAAKR
jgi:cell division inhibitor SulA